MVKAPARSKKTPQRRPWSKDDVKVLKGLARKEAAGKIAKQLKRTEGATRQKATALGISLNVARRRAPRRRRPPRSARRPRKLKLAAEGPSTLEVQAARP